MDQSSKLSPIMKYGGAKLPIPPDERVLHHLAHEQCFIASSAKREILVAAT
jgi:hypothetical protein